MWQRVRRQPEPTDAAGCVEAELVCSNGQVGAPPSSVRTRLSRPVRALLLACVIRYGMVTEHRRGAEVGRRTWRTKAGQVASAARVDDLTYALPSCACLKRSWSVPVCRPRAQRQLACTAPTKGALGLTDWFPVTQFAPGEAKNFPSGAARARRKNITQPRRAKVSQGSNRRLLDADDPLPQ